MHTKSLQESYSLVKYPLAGHGKRNVEVLKKAFEQISGSIESEMYGKGKVIEDFQDKMANLLGKEAAVFFPSGTMAQQIALRIWCDEKGVAKVAYHPLSHLEIHEEDGLKELHHIETVLLADQTRVIELDDVTGMEEDVACLLLELPQREIGGQLPDYGDLEKISAYCREKGIKLQLDGARLLEVLPYYKKTAAEVCALFDSVYVSLYKGIGGIAGAVLAGSKEFTEKSKVWKRRHGGDLISLYPYILSADYYYDQRSGKMDAYYEEAKELAQLYNSCEGVYTLPTIPVSNMFHVHFEHPKGEIEPILIQIQEETGIGFTGNLREKDSHSSYYEVSIGDLYEEVPKDLLNQSFQLLNEKMAKAFE
ncbi:low specificity L-threonine aldolase [Bacillus infantis]|uniref:threonine aldolase family protein n=1 Tax=Bacillus infantis TaxID=324767 RepID=UPI00101DB23A|nr:beta-eliminating lyase-related protein [Bacillus infantis]MCA1035068.1 low specificity L-threonine aldolase [Bacillus infantis]RYI29575.1 low specificity L-threonine aldolase [Bacillus infantis]